jgi:hypothetical protein
MMMMSYAVHDDDDELCCACHLCCIAQPPSCAINGQLMLSTPAHSQTVAALAAVVHMFRGRSRPRAYWQHLYNTKCSCFKVCAIFKCIRLSAVAGCCLLAQRAQGCCLDGVHGIANTNSRHWQCRLFGDLMSNAACVRGMMCVVVAGVFNTLRD